MRVYASKDCHKCHVSSSKATLTRATLSSNTSRGPSAQYPSRWRAFLTQAASFRCVSQTRFHPKASVLGSRLSGGQCSLVLQPNPYPVCQRVSLAASEPRFVWIGLLDRPYSCSLIVLSFFVEARFHYPTQTGPKIAV